MRSMKSKFLFGALVGTVALASCNADDELTSVPSAQQSPITFTVSLENGDALTKAEVTSDMKVNFESGDLLSLFHGVDPEADPFTTFTGYQNAIYEGSAQEGQAFVFTTKSMVLPGRAIMVYPADTTFANGGSAAPVISIPADQNAETKLLTPHMSEVLTSGEYDETSGSNTAGYGKNYDIVLKRVGATLRLTADLRHAEAINNLDVAPLKLTSAVLRAVDNSKAGALTTAISVKVGTGTPASDDEYEAWTEVSEADQANVVAANQVGKLTTTDIANNNVAIFTLLPTKSSTTASAAGVVVKTNYGKVAMYSYDEAYNSGNNSGVGEEIWTQSDQAAKTVLDGVNDILSKTYIAETRNTSLFTGELVGTSAQRGIEVDVRNLDMDGLHITDENHLLDALTVYDAIYASRDNKEVTWYLEGDENGEFVMNAEAAAAYAARLADADNEISFARCNENDKETECKAVRFINVNAEAMEVPANLLFTLTEGSVSAGDADKVNVILEGAWKYTTGSKKFDLVSALTVDKDATLVVSGTIAANVLRSNSFSIINNGTVNVSGTTNLALNMTNNGTINIPKGAQLFTSAQVTLTNQATSLTEYGVINNAGSMGVRTGSSGTINNYGYIEQMNAEAYTYVTNNAIGNDFDAAFSSSNKMGTIMLYGTGNVNTTVGTAGTQGFIKVRTTAETVNDEVVGKVANYVEITGNCTSCNLTGNAIKYIDVKSNNRVIFEGNSLTVDGLIVDNGYSINIPTGSSVTVSKAVYLKGYIYYAGTYSATTYVGYLGGVAGDNTNAIYNGVNN